MANKTINLVLDHGVYNHVISVYNNNNIITAIHHLGRRGIQRKIFIFFLEASFFQIHILIFSINKILMVSKAQRSFRSGFLVLKDILERAGSIGYTINIPACVENVLVDLVGPQVSGPVSRGNLQKGRIL